MASQRWKTINNWGLQVRNRFLQRIETVASHVADLHPAFFGHAIGDEVLKATARTILACTRSSDVVARIGGDEFVVASQSVPSEGDVTALTHRIKAAFLSPIHINGNDLTVGISIGVAKYPQDGVTIDELLVHSDRAMYMDKQTHTLSKST